MAMTCRTRLFLPLPIGKPMLWLFLSISAYLVVFVHRGHGWLEVDNDKMLRFGVTLKYSTLE